MQKCNFNKVSKQYSPVNLLHIFRAPFTKNISGWLLLLAVKAGASFKKIDQGFNLVKQKFSSKK